MGRLKWTQVKIYREMNYSIYKTRYGNYYYVFIDGNSTVLFMSEDFQRAIDFIKGKLK